MSTDSPEYKNYDVQYSIRLPQDLADEINARAEHDGVKPSTWIRNTLAKTIKTKDAKNAGNIKTAVLYLLTTDKDVQKQIRLLSRDIREKGSRMSEIESTLTEFTALSDQEIILERKMEELNMDISELQNKLSSHGDILRDIEEKKYNLTVAFRNSDGAENLRSIIEEFNNKEGEIRNEMFSMKHLLDEKRNQMIGYKVFISDLTVRKKQLLNRYNQELHQNRNSGIEMDDSDSPQKLENNCK